MGPDKFGHFQFPIYVYMWEGSNKQIPISCRGAWVTRAIKSAKDRVYALNPAAWWEKKHDIHKIQAWNCLYNLQPRLWLSLSRAGIPTRRSFPFLSWYFFTRDCPGNDCMASRLMCPPISWISWRSLQSLDQRRWRFGVFPLKAPIQNDVENTSYRHTYMTHFQDLACMKHTRANLK